MKRQVTPILLPMENGESDLIKSDRFGDIFYQKENDSKFLFTPLQLIIVEDSEIKVGDYYMNDIAGVVVPDVYKKVVAAYPLIPNIPPISPQFIQSYADANGKGEVWVEYDELFSQYFLDLHGCAVLELMEEKERGITINGSTKPAVDNLSDAIEFCSWPPKNGWRYQFDEDKWYHYDDIESDYPKTTLDLYSLFKSNTDAAGK